MNERALNPEMKRTKECSHDIVSASKSARMIKTSNKEKKKSLNCGSSTMPQVVSTNLIQCSFCSESFPHEIQFLFHHEHAHADKLHFACSLCKQRFAAISLLSDHVSKHNIPSVFKCSKCSKSFTSPIDLVKHKCNVTNVAHNIIDNDKTIVNTDTQQSVLIHSNVRNKHMQLNESMVHTQYHMKCLNNLNNTLETEFQSRLSNRELQLQSTIHESQFPYWVSDNEIKLLSINSADPEPKLSVQNLVTWLESERRTAFTGNDIQSGLSQSSMADNRAIIESNLKFTSLTESNVQEHDEIYKNNRPFDHCHLLMDIDNNNTCISSNNSDKTVSWYPDVQSCSVSSRCSEKMVGVMKVKRSYACSQCARMFTTQSSLKRHSRIHSNDVKIFKCSHCDKIFLHKHHLTQHESTHSAARHRTYKCAQCGRGFYYKQNLDRHIPTHLGERFPCSTCGKTFIGMRGLTLHKLIHAAEHNYVCTVCDKKFPRLSDLTAHSRRQHRNNNPIICKKCDISFSKISALWVHMKNVHNEERSWLCVRCGDNYSRKERYKHRHFDVFGGAEKHACLQCDKSFSLLVRFKAHVKVVHNEARHCYSCTSCDKKFTSKGRLNAHKISHSDAKEFACALCAKTCNRRYDLTMHVRRKHNNSNSSNPLLPCPQCYKMFSVSANLQAHVRRIHTDDRPFLCPQCGHSYTTKASLVNHLLVHDEARHVCTLCGKKFRHSVSFKYHMNHVHGDTKPSFVCSICNKRFTSKGSLNCHTLIHTGERRHVCDQCDKRFTKSHDLKIHLRRVHSNFRPFPCEQCEKRFATRGQLVVHRQLHCTLIQR